MMWKSSFPPLLLAGGLALGPGVGAHAQSQASQSALDTGDMAAVHTSARHDFRKLSMTLRHQG